MQPIPLMGPMELVLLLMFSGGGLGLPTGIPPEKEDPLMAQVAPADCLFYTSWAGTAAPNAASRNHTEQLLAEPQVRKFIEEALGSLTGAIQQGIATGNAEGAARAEMATKLLKTFTTHGGAVFLTDVTIRQGGAPDVSGGLIVNLGDAVEETRAILEKLQTEIATTEIKTVEIGKAKFFQFRPDPTAPLITWGTRGKYLIAGLGEGSVESLMQRARGEPPAWLTKLRSRLAIPRISSVSYVNVKRVVTLVANASGEPRADEVIRLLGLDKLVAFGAVSGLDEKGFASRSLLMTEGSPTGLLSFLDTKPLAADDLQTIPQNTPAAVAFKLDPEAMLNLWLSIVGQIDPNAARQMAQGIGQMEQQFGLNLRDDILKPLGDTWRIHADPDNGGVLTGWVISVSLRDRQRFGQTHDRLLQMAGGALNGGQPGAPALRQSVVAGHKVHTLVSPQPGIPLAPSWCLTDRELLISATPQSIQATLSRKKGAPSLAAQPDLAPTFQGQFAPLAVVYYDTKQVFQTVYPFVQGLLQTAASQGNPGAAAMPRLSGFPPADVVAKHLQPSVNVLLRTPDGLEFSTRQTLPGGNIGATAPVSIALLLPAVQAAREAARRTQGSNNLKQILLAMHNYHDVYAALPAAYSVDKDGKPLLSWRVHILPYLEQAPLYEKFHLDEPWDSEHNKTLIPLMPKLYQGPGSIAEAGKTNYLGVCGSQGVFLPGTKAKTPTGITFHAVTDGTSNTIAVVEANDASTVIWTKPDDYEPNEKDLLKGLVGLRANGFQVGFCDGSVRFISQAVDKVVLKAMFTKAGGEPIPQAP